MSSFKREMVKYRGRQFLTIMKWSVGIGVPLLAGYAIPIYIGHDIEHTSIHHEPGVVTNILTPVATKFSFSGRSVVSVTLDDHRFGSIRTYSSIREHDRVDVAFRTGKSGRVYIEGITPLQQSAGAQQQPTEEMRPM